MNSVNQNHHIYSVDAGFLGLAAAVIMQAVEDVRLYLTFPKFTDTAVNRKNASYRTNQRKVQADRAAKWLQGPECNELVIALRACGHVVPMRRLFRELAALKKEVSAHG